MLFLLLATVSTIHSYVLLPFNTNLIRCTAATWVGQQCKKNTLTIKETSTQHKSSLLSMTDEKDNDNERGIDSGGDGGRRNNRYGCYKRDMALDTSPINELVDKRLDATYESGIEAVKKNPFNKLGSGRNRNSGGKMLNYTKSVHSPKVDLDERLIDALIKERTRFKMTRNFDKANAVREGLLNKYNIILDDRLCQWSVGGNFGEENNVQRQTSADIKKCALIKSDASDDQLSQADELFIQTKINDRTQAKKNRNFDSADAIAKELLDRYNVYIHDKFRQWSVGGKFVSSAGRLINPFGTYTRRGGSDISKVDLFTINRMLKARSQARKLRNFNKADDIQSELRKSYGVQLDDKAKEWHIDNGSKKYIQVFNPGSRSASDLSLDDIDIISTKIEQRFDSRNNRDYEAADAIRDELKEKFNVIIHDKYKEWKCVKKLGDNDDEGEGSYDDFMFQQEAARSQSSAFKQTERERELVSAFDSIFGNNIESSYDDSDEDVDGSSTDIFYSTSLESNDVDNTDHDDNGAEEEMGVDNKDDLTQTDVNPEPEEDEVDLKRMTVPKLKDKLRDAGLPVSGKKAELIVRLLNKT